MATESPDWAFGPDLKIKCPTCKETSTGFDWIMPEAPGPEDPPVGMSVLPCSHNLSMPPWSLDVSGRGNVTFVREKNA